LLASGGLYADLYRTQFARQAPVGAGPRSGPPGGHFPPPPPPGADDLAFPGGPWRGGAGPGPAGRP
jgi:ATP-binding cassette subfamily B protein